MKNILVYTLIFVSAYCAALFLNAAINKSSSTISTTHAIQAIVACNELKLESESFKSEYSGVGDLYTITSNCSNKVQIILTIPSPKVVTKGA